MYEKIKSWFKSINPIYIFVIIIIDIIIFYFCSMLGENVHNNRNAINNIRTELNGVEQTKSNIECSVENVEKSNTIIGEGIEEMQKGIDRITESNSIAQTASKGIDEITRECQSILEQIRMQHE